MDKRQVDFKSLGRQYKGSLLFEIGLFCLSVVVGAVLLFKVVIPQIQTWSSMNEEIKVTKAHIATINDNITYLQSLNDEDVQDSFETATSALPVNPDFTGAMQAILSSSISSGAQLGEFTFTVGTIATTSAGTKKDPTQMEININAKGDGKILKDFIGTIYTYLPLSSISTAISTTEDSPTKITIDFPSSPLTDVSFSKTEAIPKNSSKNLDTLTTLKTWKEQEIVLSDDTASTSSTLPPPF